jgi:hypothetical protein
MFIEDFKYDCRHQKETHSAISSDDEEFKETLKILENIRNELKAQKTPKKYLTYDDLMKLETEKVENGIRNPIAYKVRLNGYTYKMWVTQYDNCREICIWDKNDREMVTIYAKEKRKDFINDLHLELVEE